jgi:hypothetical protein
LKYRRPPSSFSVSNDDALRQSNNILAGDDTTGMSQPTEVCTPVENPPSSSLRKAMSRSFSSWNTHRITKKKSKALHPRTQEVFTQAVLYVLAFYVTHAWSTATRIIQQMHPGRIYFQLAIFHASLKPLQGFTNFLVYQRPQFRRIRAKRPELPYWQVIHRVLRFSFLPPLDGGSGFGTHSTTQSRVDVNKGETSQVDNVEDIKRPLEDADAEMMMIEYNIQGNEIKLHNVDPSTDLSEEIADHAPEQHGHTSDGDRIEVVDATDATGNNATINHSITFTKVHESSEGKMRESDSDDD